MNIDLNPFPRFVDVLTRFLSDHQTVLSAESTLLNQLLLTAIEFIQSSTSLGTCCLIIYALNDLFVNLSDIPAECASVIPDLLKVLVLRSAWPIEAFQTTPSPPPPPSTTASQSSSSLSSLSMTGVVTISSFMEEEEADAVRKLRQASQDTVLALAMSSIGVYSVASTLIAVTGEIHIQESVLCLFYGIVDAIEETILSLFDNQSTFSFEDIPVSNTNDSSRC